MSEWLQVVYGGLTIGAIYALVALGFSLIYRTIGLVNFAQGGLLMLGAYVGAILLADAGMPFPLAIIVAVVVIGTLGLAVERLLRPLERGDLMMMVLATLGLDIVFTNSAIVLFGSEGMSVAVPVVGEPIQIAGVTMTRYSLVVIGSMILIALGLNTFLNRTKTGLGMRAIAINRDIALVFGVNANRMNNLALGIGAGIAAAGGVLIAPILYVTPQLGASVGISGFAAAILGGLGNLPGAIVGGLLFGVFQSVVSVFLPAYVNAIAFVIFVLVLLVRPWGILGERVVEKL
jgi:branched-chain amino acid transport system permease protein